MNAEWQSWITGGVVAVTAAAFVLRALRKKKGGCASCGRAPAPRGKAR